MGFIKDYNASNAWYNPVQEHACEVFMTENPVIRYLAAGGVIVHNGRVLILHRPHQNEVRLPKGHVEPGEMIHEAALRETYEESGYKGLQIVADLGTQIVEFEYQGRHIVRTERYFLMNLADPTQPMDDGEAQFTPEWLTWDKALKALTFAAEREWVRRARKRAHLSE